MTYQVPPDTNEKEKILGGMFTLAQTAWLAGGIIIAAIIFLVFGKTLGMGVGALFLAVPCLFLGAPFAFMKKHELALFDYLRRSHEFKSITKRLPNYRKEAN